jgi:hypothetical protein
MTSKVLSVNGNSVMSAVCSLTRSARLAVSALARVTAMFLPLLILAAPEIGSDDPAGG